MKKLRPCTMHMMETMRSYLDDRKKVIKLKNKKNIASINEA